MSISVKKIQTFIKCLNNFDIKDLKTINIEKIKDTLIEKIDFVIQCILGLVTFVCILLMYNGHVTTSKDVKIEIARLAQDLKTFKKHETIKQQHSKFIKSFPEFLDADQLMEKLSEFAIESNVEIGSFNPMPEKKTDLITMNSLHIDINVNEYANLVQFMQKVSNSMYAIRIERWSVVKEEQRFQKDGEVKGASFKVDMTIKTIKIHDK